LEDDLSFKVSGASNNSGSNRESFPPRGLLFAAADGARANGKEVNMFSDFFRRMHITVLTRHEDGQTMAEYAVVLAVITIAAVGAFLALGKKIGPAIDTVTGYIP